jgi:UDP-glucose 4-epimerase
VSELVAVTGAEGFIGSHLVEELVAQGYRVRAMVLYNSFGSWGWLERLDEDVMANVEVQLGDVRDPGSVMNLMRDVDVVYHLAALIAIPFSYIAPRTYVETNVGGTLNVLEAARTLGTRRVVQTSTSEVYGTARIVPIPETHPLQAQSPYSASKIGADKLVESYHLSFGLPVVTLRPFNAYGPRQSARAVIPTIISQIAAGNSVIKLGSLDPTRDFTFVKDTARAFVAVGTAEAAFVEGKTLNAGSGRDISIGDLVLRIAHIMGEEIDVVADAPRQRPADSEVMRLLADSSAMAKATGWSPSVTLDQGLAMTCEWLSDPENLAGYKTAIYNV